MTHPENNSIGRTQNNKIQAISLTSDSDFRVSSDGKVRDSQESSNNKHGSSDLLAQDSQKSETLIGGEIDLLIK